MAARKPAVPVVCAHINTVWNNGAELCVDCGARV